MKYELGGNIFWIKGKKLWLLMTAVKIKKQKAQKSVIKTKLEFENYKNCSEATQLDNKTNYLEKKKHRYR